MNMLLIFYLFIGLYIPRLEGKDPFGKGTWKFFYVI